MALLEDQFLNVTEFATIADVRPSEPPTADMVQVMQAIRGQPHQRSSHINIISRTYAKVIFLGLCRLQGFLAKFLHSFLEGFCCDLADILQNSPGF